MDGVGSEGGYKIYRLCVNKVWRWSSWNDWEGSQGRSSLEGKLRISAQDLLSGRRLRVIQEVGQVGCCLKYQISYFQGALIGRAVGLIL